MSSPDGSQICLIFYLKNLDASFKGLLPGFAPGRESFTWLWRACHGFFFSATSSQKVIRREYFRGFATAPEHCQSSWGFSRAPEHGSSKGSGETAVRRLGFCAPEREFVQPELNIKPVTTPHSKYMYIYSELSSIYTPIIVSENFLAVLENSGYELFRHCKP